MVSNLLEPIELTTHHPKRVQMKENKGGGRGNREGKMRANKGTIRWNTEIEVVPSF